MTRTINNIDKNFHESFSAKGFRYLNAGGGASTELPGGTPTKVTTSRCPPGYEWSAGRCWEPVAANADTRPPMPAPPPSPPAPPPRPGGEPPVPPAPPTPPFPTPIPVPVPVPVPTPTPLPSVPSDSTPSGPVYPSIPGGGGGASGGGAGYEEPAEYMEEVAVLPAEEINWPAIAIAGAVVGLTYWYMGKEKAAA